MGKKPITMIPPDSDIHANQSAFRIMERTMKRADPNDSKMLVDIPSLKTHCVNLFGKEQSIIEFHEYPGLYLIKNALSEQTQRDLCKEALQNWVQPPNISNLDSHYCLGNIGVWNQFAAWNHGVIEPIIQRRLFNHSAEHIDSTSLIDLKSLDRKKDGRECAIKKITTDSLSKLVIDEPTDIMQSKCDMKISKILPRLRWSTLGLQYNWTNKQYHFDRVVDFPHSLNLICNDIIDSVSSFTGYPCSKWKCEAGILNFYRPGDALMAHQDKSEINSDAPLISISLGLDCIFLFGTENRADKPMAIKLQSGDLIVMSQTARKAFHGVPRVIADTCPAHLLIDTHDWSLFKEFFRTTRMNINVRQVY